MHPSLERCKALVELDWHLDCGDYGAVVDTFIGYEVHHHASALKAKALMGFERVFNRVRTWKLTG